jgi:hypothetical protein
VKLRWTTFWESAVVVAEHAVSAVPATARSATATPTLLTVCFFTVFISFDERD